MSLLGLLATRRFLPLFITQALGAINDNLFKNALVVLALYHLTRAGPVVVALAGGVFILPYALFSATAGQLADKYDKSRLIRLTKLWELGLMLLAAAGFLSASIPALLLVLFGLGAQAAFFSPLKYASLPELLAEAELGPGNGLIEAGTFLAILAGTIAGGLLFALPGGAAIVSLAGVALALAGIAAARGIPDLPPAAPDLGISRNFIAATFGLLREAHARRPVWLACLGISWFWAVGATLLAELPTIARQNLHAGPGAVTLMLAGFSIGIGIGALACAAIRPAHRRRRLVPLAAAGISLFMLDFAAAAAHGGALHSAAAILGSWPGRRLLADLLLLAAAGGMFSVPLYIILQEAAAAAMRARMIAANNVMNALAMTAAALLTAALYAALPSAPLILAVTAMLNLAVVIWIIRALARVKNHAGPE